MLGGWGFGELGLEELLGEGQLVLVALVLESLAQVWWAAVEDVYLATLLADEVLEDDVPVGPTAMGSLSQAVNQRRLLLREDGVLK